MIQYSKEKSDRNDQDSIYLLGYRHHTSYVTDGCWSPVRPGVFFTTQWDGSLNVWDFAFKQKEAALTVKVTI
jgi:dynein intermediate chain 2